MLDKPVILIVDDSKINIDILTNVLGDEFDIIPAIDGQTAIEITKNEYISIILLDIIMPNMSGFDTCKIIKSNSQTKDIPILFLTSKDKTKDIQKGFELGAIDYITKPFNPVELLIRVRNHIELSSYRINLENRVQQEISKVQEAHKLMIQQSKLADMGELINMIAHQWRQPLGSIGSILISVEFAIQGGKYNLANTKDGKEFVEFIKEKNKKIQNSLDFLSQTIDDFSDFYKKDKEKAYVKISEAIHKTLDIVQIVMNNNGIDIKTEFKTDDKINIYQNELMQVILNILKNSEDNFLIKEVSHPKIMIETKKENDNYIISIEDNGGGIPKDILRDIFNPYFSTKLNKNGTGLGLYMSKTIIENHHNGKLNAYNKNDGVCFEIILKE